MHYQIIQPSAKLRPFVRAFWIFEHSFKEPEYVYRSMADGCAELIFHYKGTFEEISPDGNIAPLYSLVHAQSHQFKRFVTKDSFGIFGVYLYPFAIPQLFQLPSWETSNQIIDLTTLLGADGKELEERIMLANSNSQRLAILSCFLEKKLYRSTPKDLTIQASIQHIVHSNKLLSVQQLSDKFNLSPRQFERRFKEYAGYSPKLYSRLIRFQLALKEYNRIKQKSLAEIAYQCGYYDQSHFIHNFKAFSGYHPKRYFAGKAEGIEYREV